MFVAHVPAGYLLTRRIAPRASTRLLVLGLVASVLPDFDLIWFYLVDHGRVLHHAYWTHQPFWWALLAIAWLGAAWLRGSRAWALAGAVLFGSVFVHLLLDTVAGGIHWLARFSDRNVVLFTVRARYDWWVWNFVLSWTFLIEVAITAWAARELVTEFRRRGAAGGLGGPRNPRRGSEGEGCAAALAALVRRR
jgi:inner membrane protein